ncbi:MAG: hypothetical protein RLZZ568_203, partial [Cyanobacteriota bacterium]|jgi:hypothetical protein
MTDTTVCPDAHGLGEFLDGRDPLSGGLFDVLIRNATTNADIHKRC